MRILAYMDRDYKRERENRKHYVLLKKGELVGVFGNLKKLADYGIDKFNDFPSYSTLSKKKENKIIIGKYVIESTKII